MLEQIGRELLELCEMVKQVEGEISKADQDIQRLKDELEKRLAQRDRVYAQIERLRREEASLRKRQQIALRVLRRGRDPTFVFELSEEGLAKLEKRLVELEEVRKARLRQQGLDWFIRQLLRKPAQQKKRELPLLCDDLPKDPARLRKVKKAKLEKECNDLTIQLGWIKNQIQVVMGYEDSEGQIVRLEDSVARIEKELRQKQEELARLTGQMSASSERPYPSCIQ